MHVLRICDRGHLVDYSLCDNRLSGLRIGVRFAKQWGEESRSCFCGSGMARTLITDIPTPQDYELILRVDESRGIFTPRFDTKNLPLLTDRGLRDELVRLS